MTNEQHLSIMLALLAIAELLRDGAGFHANGPFSEEKRAIPYNLADALRELCPDVAEQLEGVTLVDPRSLPKRPQPR